MCMCVNVCVYMCVRMCVRARVNVKHFLLASVMSVLAAFQFCVVFSAALAFSLAVFFLSAVDFERNFQSNLTAVPSPHTPSVCACVWGCVGVSVYVPVEARQSVLEHRTPSCPT